MRTLLWLTYLLIAYGSLFPFDFTLAAMAREDVSLLQIKLPSIGDLLGNVLLFVPTGYIGFALTRQLGDGPPARPQTLGKLILWGGLFALLLQVIQLTLPARDPSIMDVLLNILGLVIGWQLARHMGTGLIKLPTGIALLPLLIGSGYILSLLSPFVPTIDLQSIKNSLKPLLSADLSITDFFVAASCWLVAVRLVFWQQPHYRARGLLAIWFLVLVGKILIYKNSLQVVDLIAPLFSLMLLKKLDIDSPKGIQTLMGLLLASLVLSSLSAFASQPGELSWVPFSGFLHGDMHTNVGSLLSKLFIYSACIWLAIEAGMDGRKTTLWLAATTLALELLQVWMPSRSAEVGEPLLVVIAYLLVRNFGDYLATQPATVSPAPTPQITATPHSKPNNQGNKAAINGWDANRSILIQIAISFLLFVVAVKAILSLPGIPYNVLQLFRNDGSLIDLACFFTALLLAGGSAIWIAKLHQQQPWPRRGYLAKLHLLSASLVYVMIWYAVSEDSLKDITGTVLSVQALNETQQHDTTLAVIFKVLGVTNIRSLLEFLEPGLRFFALYGLFQVPFVYFLLKCQASPQTTTKRITSHKLTESLILIAICYYFTFPAASTDNLTELIASPLLFCLLLALYALVLALMVRTLLSDSRHKKLKLISGALLLSLAGWLAALITFTPQLHKYGITFSALEFLLGPDRNTRLTSIELMLRWFTVSIAFQLTILWAVQLCAGMQIPANLRQRSTTVFRSRFFTPKILLPSLLLIGFSGYMTNRLIGEHLHWQTLSQHFASDAPYALDRSVAVVPEGAAPGEIYLDGQRQPSLEQALKRAQDRSIIQIGAGYYNEAGVLSANSVLIKAEKGAVVYGKAALGKGALVLKGDFTTIEGLECHSVSVPDGNGKCVRLEGKGVTLREVYFHHAQGGLLGSRKGGDIIIENSLFEHLGDGSFSHGVYSFKPTRLIIKNSKFLNNRSGAHEIKSRSYFTKITDSVIAAPQSRDSRLLDVANGGTLVLQRNILIEGPFSENHDMLSWGVEHSIHNEGSITINDNLFISDMKASRLISIKNKPELVDISSNIVIGDIKGVKQAGNFFFKSREEFSLEKYPEIPSWN